MACQQILVFDLIWTFRRPWRHNSLLQLGNFQPHLNNTWKFLQDRQQKLISLRLQHLGCLCHTTLYHLGWPQQEQDILSNRLNVHNATKGVHFIQSYINSGGCRSNIPYYSRLIWALRALNISKTNRPNITCNNISTFIKKNLAFLHIVFLRQPNNVQTYSSTEEHYYNTIKCHWGGYTELS